MAFDENIHNLRHSSAEIGSDIVNYLERADRSDEKEVMEAKTRRSALKEMSARINRIVEVLDRWISPNS